LAFWIEADEHRLLFDTGQGEALPRNVHRLGIPINTTKKVILSHGHSGHAGGLMSFVRLGGCPAECYAHPDATQPKFGPSDGPPYPMLGMSDDDRAALRVAYRTIWTKGPTEVAKGIYVTGEIPRRNHFESSDRDYYLDEAGTQLDPLLDEQAAFIETRGGLVVLLGCAHPGVVNTLEYVAELTGASRIRAVLGGTHLTADSRERLECTADTLARYDVQQIVPTHGTSLPALAYLWSRLPGKCVDCSVGTQLTFGKKTQVEQLVAQPQLTGLAATRAVKHRRKAAIDAVPTSSQLAVTSPALHTSFK
jgi:7,8-dihydropterin-6-yl-methyl-4-(beta-D-ribofuranosyl)aminobenzene 5'-phosphate synthase